MKYVTAVSILLQIAISRELGLDLIARVFERNPEFADVWECPLNTSEHVKCCTRLLSNVEMTGGKKFEILFQGKIFGTDVEFLWRDLSCLAFLASHSARVVRAKRESDSLRVVQGVKLSLDGALQEIPHQCALAGSGAAPGKWLSCRSLYLSLRKMEESNCSDWRDNTVRVAVASCQQLPGSQPAWRGSYSYQLGVLES